MVVQREILCDKVKVFATRAFCYKFTNIDTAILSVAFLGDELTESFIEECSFILIKFKTLDDTVEIVETIALSYQIVYLSHVFRFV